MTTPVVTIVWDAMPSVSVFFFVWPHLPKSLEKGNLSDVEVVLVFVQHGKGVDGL